MAKRAKPEEIIAKLREVDPGSRFTRIPQNLVFGRDKGQVKVFIFSYEIFEPAKLTVK